MPDTPATPGTPATPESPDAPVMPNIIATDQTADEQHLRQILIRDQMTSFVDRPFIVERADGIYYWDIHGKRYIDGIAGIYVASVGHNNRRVIDAVHKQMDELTFSPPMHGTNNVSIQLANVLSELAPGDLAAAKFCTGGAEATETAMKMARQYHKLRGRATKYKIISRYQSWHGATFGGLAASGLPSRRAANEPLAAGFVHVFPPTCYRCPFGKNYPDCQMTCVTLIEDVIRMEGPDTVAAVIVEPIGNTGGIIDPPPEYLPMLREICDRHDVLLIFDEIINGIGRTGELFAAQTFGVVPDMLCIGKALAGGYAPLSAVLTRRHIADTFWGDAATNPGFLSGHTFEGNPVACAAALATLREIIDNDLCANARRVGQRIRRGFEGLTRHGIVGDIRGKGLYFGVEWVKDPATKQRFDPPLGTLIGRRALQNGLLTRFDPHWLALGPALNITDQDADEMIAILDRSVTEALEEYSRAQPNES